MARPDGDSRTLLELIALARADLDRIETQARWRNADLDGQRVTDTLGRSSNVAADPTMAQTISRSHVAAKLAKARTRLTTLVDTTLPAIYGVLRLADERALIADDNDPHDTDPDMDPDVRAAKRAMGPARLDGGLSAYRGDRKAPAGRPDLHQALQAQHRRLDRGEGYGRG